MAFTPAATAAIVAAVCISFVSVVAAAAICGLCPRKRRKRAPAPPGWLSFENLGRSHDYVPESEGYTQGGGYRPPGFANPLPLPSRPLLPNGKNQPNDGYQPYGINEEDPQARSTAARSEKEVCFSGMYVMGPSHCTRMCECSTSSAARLPTKAHS
jgi:hypothetical protein